MSEKKIYHIIPVLTESLWGGQQLREKYGYQSDMKNIGEVYNVIAMKGHLDCDVQETGEKLSDFYHSHQELFRCSKPEMPLRAAMACTAMPMSVQIHPNNEYALAHDGKMGKPDGVYVLEGDGTVEFGHYAKTRAEFRAMAEEGAWNSLLRYINVKAGDFLDMPYGTLHALGANMIFYEFAQNADITYRLYDYQRTTLDPRTGKPRELHVEKVCECVNIPNSETQVAILKRWTERGCDITSFHDEPGVYTCGKLDVKETGVYDRDQFYFLTCIEGNGLVDDVVIKGGETLFIPCDYGEVTLKGEFTLTYVTYVRP